MNRIALRILWILALAAAIPVSASSPPLPDTRILIDVSGSMKKNDPDNLRRPALRLLVGLLPSGSHAGVWTFGQYVNMLVPLGVVDEGWRARARKGAKQVHSRGLFTQIEEAIRRGSEDWSGPPGERGRHLVLLTDGMVDVSKDPAESERSRERVLQEQLPRLRQLGVKVHTVALSSRADFELLRRLSEATGGWAEQVASAAALQRIFLRIFEKVGNPDTLPLVEDRFKVDASIRELTLILFRPEGAEPTRISLPDGRSFTRSEAPDNVRWHADAGYELLTVSNPMAGEWTLQGAEDPDNRVMILTDLRMQVSELPNRLVAGQRVPMQVSFTDEGKVINRREFIDVVNLALEQLGPQGAGNGPRPLRDDGRGDDPQAYDGRFELRFQPDGGPGRAELLVRAEGKTFQREKRLLFELLVPATAELAPGAREGLLQLRVWPVTEVVTADSLEVTAELEGKDGGHTPLELTHGPDGSYLAELDTARVPGRVQLWLRVRARTLVGDVVAARLPPMWVQGTKPPAPPAAEQVQPPASDEPEEEAPPEEEGMGLWIGLGIGHLVVLLLAGLGFWLWRRRAARDLVQLVEDEPEASGTVPEATEEEKAA